MWEEIGRLQFDYLVGAGLRPSHCFLDIACGSLRGGVHFIPYLEAGKYLGLDRDEELIQSGVERELGTDIFELKRPEFVVSATFEFDRFRKKPQLSLAQSLFTHLDPGAIRQCLERLGAFADPGHVFFATFFEGSSAPNPGPSQGRGVFRYSREEMTAFAGSSWRSTYIGAWNHPRGQMMMKYELE